MNLLDEQIEVLTALIRANGGMAHIDPNAPEYVKRAWIDMILNCPDCREEFGRKK